MKGVMSTPNNPYSSNNDGRGDMPSYGDYSQGANDSYNSGYNSAYNEGPHRLLHRRLRAVPYRS